MRVAELEHVETGLLAALRGSHVAVAAMEDAVHPAERLLDDLERQPGGQHRAAHGDLGAVVLHEIPAAALDERVGELLDEGLHLLGEPVGRLRQEVGVHEGAHLRVTRRVDSGERGVHRRVLREDVARRVALRDREMLVVRAQLPDVLEARQEVRVELLDEVDGSFGAHPLVGRIGIVEDGVAVGMVFDHRDLLDSQVLGSEAASRPAIRPKKPASPIDVPLE